MTQLKDGKRIFCIEPGTENGRPLSAELMIEPRKKAIVVIAGRASMPAMGPRPIAPAAAARSAIGMPMIAAPPSSVFNAPPPLVAWAATVPTPAAAIKGSARPRPWAAREIENDGAAIARAPRNAPSETSRTSLTLARRGESRLARR